MRSACWIIKAADTNLEYEILLFHGNNDYANAPHITLYLHFLSYFMKNLS